MKKQKKISSPLRGEDAALAAGGGEKPFPHYLRYFSRALRYNMTDAERHLWRHLRKQQTGYKFRRQQPIGQYIVDFVCLKNKLVIEVDGGQHSNSINDIMRDTFLITEGYHVLRFWNQDVLENIDGVIQTIINHPHPNLPPSRGKELGNHLPFEGEGRERQRASGGALVLLLFAMVFVTTTSFAQQADTKKPIEVASDTLEVLQNEQKAIFVGNVIATQGNINMRAERMVVFYRETPGGNAAASAAGAKGIYRIEAHGKVIFTTPTETGQGDQAIYNVDTETVDLLGNVTLTRDRNVLKGTSLSYNMATGRSILNSSSGQTGGRVRGLFVPNQSGATQ